MGIRNMVSRTFDICCSGTRFTYCNSPNNLVTTSPDGVIWTNRTIEYSSWKHVTWSPELSLFVVVATNGTNRVATSPDGITWTTRSIDANSWRHVTWSPELSLFVAVANSGTNQVATSPDGITWTSRSIEASGWSSVTWSPELSLFVAVAFSGTNRVATSPDGITWTGHSIDANSWYDVSWSSELSLFVAVASNGTYQVATSINGIDWTGHSIEASGWNSVTWSPELSLFVAVAFSGTNRVATSNLGIPAALNTPMSHPGQLHVDTVTGNVGIGTTSPVAKFNIQGTSEGAPPTSGGEGTSNGIFRLRDNFNVALDIGTLGASPWTTWLQVADTTTMGSEYPLSLNPNGGNVGIGTTDPSATLHVNGKTILGDMYDFTDVTHQDAQLILGGTHNTGYNNSNQIKLLITGGNNDGGSPYYIMCEDENAAEQFYVKGELVGSGATNAKMYMKGDGEFTGYLKSANPIFYARKTTPTVHNSYIIYNGVDVNNGSCYDSSTGIFTCPVGGIYTFTWGTIGNTIDTVYRLHIHINNAAVANIHLRADNSATGSEYSTGDRTVTLSLSANDTVRIMYTADDGTSSLYGSNYTHFQGHLISYT